MTEYTEVTTFAARLSELCEFYNIKLVDVANKTGVLLSTLYRYQQGQPQKRIKPTKAGDFNVSRFSVFWSGWQDLNIPAPHHIA